MTQYQRGSLVIGATTISDWKLVKETNKILSGLVHKNIAFKSSNNAFQGAIYGRGREITIEGMYTGTQADIESFINIVESWVNADNSLQSTAQYYPFFAKGNTGSGTQTVGYTVMADDFTYTYDVMSPTLIRFSIVMREGSPLGFFSAAAGGS